MKKNDLYDAGDCPALVYRELPLADLAHDRDNPRAGDAPIEDLAADIRERGLLQPLLVEAVATAAVGGRRVIAGGRRLRALQALACTDDWPAERPVPCLELPADLGAAGRITASLAENCHREDLHWVDLCIAARAVRAAGGGLGDVQLALGVRERRARELLALAEVHPTILRAAREGRLTRETVEAYATAPTPEAQLAHFRESPSRDSAHEVRRRFKADIIDVDDPRYRYVESEYARTDAGFEESLFDHRDSWAHDGHGGVPARVADPGRVVSLAAAKLRRRANALLADGWSWIEILPGWTSWGSLEGTGLLRLDPVTPPAEAAALTRAEQRFEAADDRGADTERERRAMQAAESRATAAADWTASQRRIAGGFLWIDRTGSGETLGWVRADDQGSIAALPAAERPVGWVETEAAESAAPEPEAQSDALTRDLALARSAAIARRLHRAPADALSLLLVQLAFQARSDRGVDVVRAGLWPDAWRHWTTEAADAEAKRFSDHPRFAPLSGPTRYWLDLDSPHQAFEALRRMSLDGRLLCLACLLSSALPARARDPAEPHPLDRVADAIGFDHSIDWRPTARNYWSRIPRSRALGIAAEVCGSGVRAELEPLRRAELAQALERRFGVDSDDRAARRWVPPEFDRGEIR